MFNVPSHASERISRRIPGRMKSGADSTQPGADADRMPGRLWPDFMRNPGGEVGVEWDRETTWMQKQSGENPPRIDLGGADSLMLFTASSALPRSRDPIITVSPANANLSASPRPSGPVPPTNPIIANLSPQIGDFSDTSKYEVTLTAVHAYFLAELHDSRGVEMGRPTPEF